MNVDLYEKFWMWCSAVIIALFLALTGISAYGYGSHPPSHVETVAPQQAMADPRFATPGVAVAADGKVTVTLVGVMFAWIPAEVRVPAGRPVTFRMTSIDVTHGFEVARTNINTMVVPGFVSQLTYTFARPGEYLVVCNEFCGTGHHTMGAKIIVEATP